MNVKLLLVPYDTARRQWGSGAGPEHLLQAGLTTHLQGRGHFVADIQVIEANPDERAECFPHGAFPYPLARRGATPSTRARLLASRARARNCRAERRRYAATATGVSVGFEVEMLSSRRKTWRSISEIASGAWQYGKSCTC